MDGGVRCVGSDASSLVLRCIDAVALSGGSKTDDVSMIWHDTVLVELVGE